MASADCRGIGFRSSGALNSGCGTGHAGFVEVREAPAKPVKKGINAMSVQAAYEESAYEESIKNIVIRAQDLETDHHLLRSLLNRFEIAYEASLRRNIMQVVVDLFELHSAIEAQMFPCLHELSRERDAVYDLMEQVEGTDARSQLHFARGLELKRVFEVYIDREESLERHHRSQRLQRTQSNHAMLEQRAQLVDHAEQLLRLH
jgi:hypothetical protein